jgi:hypothetical protein
LEMSVPALPTWIEEPGNLSCERIHAAQIWSFLEIAPLATPTTVVRGIAAAMLSGDHVLDMKGCGSCRFREMAILATMARPLANELAKRPSHPFPGGFFRKARALACKIAMKSMA